MCDAVTGARLSARSPSSSAALTPCFIGFVSSTAEPAT
jgi:hypothetical protein